MNEFEGGLKRFEGTPKSRTEEKEGEQMEIEEILNDLTLDDLTGDIKKAAEEIGTDNIKKLSLSMGGTRLYIPQPYGLGIETIKRMVKQDSATLSTRETAEKYNIGERTVTKYRNS